MCIKHTYIYINIYIIYIYIIYTYALYTLFICPKAPLYL